MSKPAILEELIPGSTKLYFLFGGLAAEMAMPPFEFYSSARIIAENKIFLRDVSQAWYQNGLPGVGPDLYAVRDFIEQKIAELGPEEVFFVGNSMGGYAAILFAALTGTGTALAFAPQTFVSPGKRLRHRDGRWPKPIAKMVLRTALKPHIWDLKASVASLGEGAAVEIFVSEDDPLDLLHARRLQGLASVRVHGCPVGGHNLVRQLRDEGKLPDILAGSYRRSPKRYPLHAGTALRQRSPFSARDAASASAFRPNSSRSK
jgi:pimeloyl-ACP methyl ester carboxylesterase